MSRSFALPFLLISLARSAALAPAADPDRDLGFDSCPGGPAVASPSELPEREHGTTGRGVTAGPRPTDRPGRDAVAYRCEPPLDPAASRPTLLGLALPEPGIISARHVYHGESLTNMRGGVNTQGATKYDGLYDLTLRVDLQRAGLPGGGRVLLLAEEHHGEFGIAPDVGSFQALTNIQAPDFMQVSEYWWDRSCADGAVQVRLGKQDINRLFSVVEMGAPFVRASFQYPDIDPLPTYPRPGMGAVVSASLSDVASCGVGLWDGRPRVGNWGVSGSGATLSICELRIRHQTFAGLSGDCNMGLWYNSDHRNAVAPVSTQTFAGNYGVYFNAEQWLWREAAGRGQDADAESQNRRAWGVFAQYAWKPTDRNAASQYWGVGCLFRGPWSGRPRDALGAALGRVTFSDQRADRAPETAVELFYAMRLQSWLTIQPDLQFIAQPGGIHRDALIFGLRFKLLL